MIPIFIPLPAVVEVGAPELVGADLLGRRRRVRGARGSGRSARPRRCPELRASAAVWVRGTTTAKPFATIR